MTEGFCENLLKTIKELNKENLKVGLRMNVKRGSSINTQLGGQY